MSHLTHARSPRTLNASAVLLLILAFPVFGWSAGLAEYAGRYTDGKEYAVYFEMTEWGLSVRPALWTATQLLRPASADHFVVTDRESRTVEFLRDAGGRIAGVRISGMEGEGLQLRKASGPPLPVELLLSGRTALAANALRRQLPSSREYILKLASNVFQRFPTKRRAVVDFLTGFEPELGDCSKFYSLLGFAQVAAGKRAPALRSFRAAHRLDPADREVISALARLGVDEGPARWKAPFSLSSVFARPRTAEIQAVLRDWKSRDLGPAGVRVELTDTIAIGDGKGRVTVLSHLVHGYRHYGAVIVPDGARLSDTPVIVDLKGVSPTYFPLELERIESPRVMDRFAGRFIYVVPSYRGEVLKYKRHTFTSAGDRTDAIDGAADDAIAFLSVALKVTPQADRGRVCAYGHSRGGTVALLLGIRDERIRCVANVSGPVDWFYLMGTEGWTEQELWREAMRTGATPLETGGQNLERFMKKAIEGREDLAVVRRRLIASSPLYFASRLHDSQSHYGVEDTAVPVVNAVTLNAILRRPPDRDNRVFIYPAQGHDADRLQTPAKIRAFFLKETDLER